MLGNSSGDMLMQGLLYFGGNIKPTSSAFLVMRDPPGFSLKDCNALQPHPTLIKLNGNNLNHICGNWMFAGLAQVPSEVITFFQQLPLENFRVCVPFPNDLKVALYWSFKINNCPKCSFFYNNHKNVCCDNTLCEKRGYNSHKQPTKIKWKVKELYWYLWRSEEKFAATTMCVWRVSKITLLIDLQTFNKISILY